MILLVLTSVGTCFSQTEAEIKDMILRDAKAAGSATLNWEPHKILEYTHPNVAAFAGGEENMIKVLDEIKTNMEIDGLFFEAFEVLDVKDFRKEQNEYRCLVATKVTMIIEKRKVVNQSHLFGFYNEQKKQWTFVEGSQMSEAARADIFPELKTSIQIPKDVITQEKL